MGFIYVIFSRRINNKSIIDIFIMSYIMLYNYKLIDHTKIDHLFITAF
jgi:hypothetical protein